MGYRIHCGFYLSRDSFLNWHIFVDVTSPQILLVCFPHSSWLRLSFFYFFRYLLSVTIFQFHERKDEVPAILWSCLAWWMLLGCVPITEAPGTMFSESNMSNFNFYCFISAQFFRVGSIFSPGIKFMKRNFHVQGRTKTAERFYIYIVWKLQRGWGESILNWLY